MHLGVYSINLISAKADISKDLHQRVPLRSLAALGLMHTEGA